MERGRERGREREGGRTGVRRVVRETSSSLGRKSCFFWRERSVVT